MAMPRMVEQWTRTQVLALPDDGLRHELIDGVHIVSPAPRFRHQQFLLSLTLLMSPYVKGSGVAGLLSLPGDLALGEDEVLQPDLYVWPLSDDRPVREWHDITALLLVVEVLSPSTARYDRGLKRRRYQRAGVPEYWIVDLDARVVERWRPADERPEVADGTFAWRVTPDSAPLAIDLPALFAETLGTP
ncbi:MAG: Uma2 family endonuclease [Gemmatimonadaceae bacterium]|nr:Uma2 family endonuclease [Gemmatimonadaceae bacterium]